MPRVAKTAREDPSTEVRIGQTWEHRWERRQAQVTYVRGEEVVLKGKIRRDISRTTLLRDYRLVAA